MKAPRQRPVPALVTDVLILSRGEMASVGIPANEMPFFRDWAREHVNPARVLRYEEPLQRQGEVLRTAREFLQTLTGARKTTVSASIELASQQLELQVRSMRQRQVRSIPKMPRIEDTGALPTLEPMEDEAPRGRAPGKDETEGEERWDPAWGDPHEELPAARPQGMKRLPQSAPVEIPERAPKGEKQRPASGGSGKPRG